MADADLSRAHAAHAALTDLCALYAPTVHWSAPRRGLAIDGREQVTATLVREAGSMQIIDFSRVRRIADSSKIIDEFAVRFIYSGTGIEGVELAAGAQVELERLRLLTLRDGAVEAETCIETWTVLSSRHAPRP
jgi:hypothetical protein